MSQQVEPAEYYADQPLRLAHRHTDCCDQTPTTDGSFFVDVSRKSPTDELTGMPLPISPHVDLESLPDHKKNEHHHFYPRLSPELRGSLGGRALRVSRIQRVAIWQHNFGENPFHKFFPDGPDIPKDPSTQLGMGVLACAGYIPYQVVDTSSGEPIVRSIKDWEYSRLIKPNEPIKPQPYQVKRFRDRRFPGMPLFDAKVELMGSRRRQSELTYKNLIYGFDSMKKFMLERVLSQDYSEVDTTLRKRFLEREDTEAGLSILAIGSVLAAEGAEVQGSSLVDVYRDIYSDGRLHPNMPPNASTIIKHKLGDMNQRVDVLPYLRARLEYQRQQQVA